tara:strand:+ start:291 stop:542 length:252 start_codon:yes stop_codon:yes gene_type:complete
MLNGKMEKLKKLVSRVLEISEEDIHDNLSPEDVESWDSFNGLMLVSELESNFGIRFTPEEVMSVKNFGDIRYFLKKHGVVEGT